MKGLFTHSFFPLQLPKGKGRAKEFLKIFFLGVGGVERYMKIPVMKVYEVFDWRMIGVIIEAAALPVFPAPLYTFSTTIHPHYVNSCMC